MAETPPRLSKVSSTKKSIRQKRDRRKITLENKLQQYSEMYRADICLGIGDSRVRRSIYFLSRPLGVLVISQVSISKFSWSL